ncbi:sodium channel modifier 1-like isoform X2 [Juglans regia]|uniref:Sodium channel modifier 1-like isoform X2 n=1 Tax=Juglans regia TaxID=51240 RepID=A0A6P9DZS9_JUGRE|nr:sodium channel modifier 1-like isoform X2 [Juglans regia]
MSVFGGDSWAREAQQRKRRVEDLALETLDDASSYKKLLSGKYMHSKGSRHRAAESKLKERELARQDEVNKRIALSDSSVGTANRNSYHQKFRSVGKPLIELSQKATSEILCNQTPQQSSNNRNNDVQLILDRITSGNSNSSQNSFCPAIEAVDKVIAQQQHLDLQERREMELKFTAAGWKRDCHGKWFRDENVEFDSDEEDPNVCLG